MLGALRGFDETVVTLNGGNKALYCRGLKKEMSAVMRNTYHHVQLKDTGLRNI